MTALAAGFPCILVACLLSLGSEAPSQAAPTSALVCTLRVEEGDTTVDVVGGHVAGRGWVASEEAKGLLKKGDRLTLYALEAGVLGEVILTSDECVESEQPVDGGAVWGLSFKGRIVIPPGKREAYAKAQKVRGDLWHMDMVALWVEAAPEPPLLIGELLPGAREKSSEYHKIVADWLRYRGVAQDELGRMEIEQAVRADIDRDGVAEVFLAVHCAAWWGPTADGRSDQKYFSYLLMRRLPRGASSVETVILDDNAWRSLWVVGFCDLDGDGRAEVVTQGHGVDYIGAQLFHWTGSGFQLVNGWGAGA
jgi:hypothetical protein